MDSHRRSRELVADDGSGDVKRKTAHLMDTNDAMEVGGDFPAAAVIPVGCAHFARSQDDLTKTFALLQKSDRLSVVSPGGTLGIDRAATLSQRILHTHLSKKASR